MGRPRKVVVEEEKESVIVDLNINAYISEKYIKSEVQKMEMYQKISKVDNTDELMDITDELTDRYGDIPEETLRLLKVVEIKYLASKVNITSIEEKNKNVFFYFKNGNSLDVEKLSEVIKKLKGRILFSAGEKPYITLSIDEDSEDELLKNIKFLLQSIN